MTTMSRRTLVAGAMGLGLLLFGILCGMVVDRMRFDRRREAVLKPYREALARRNQELMRLEVGTAGLHPSHAARWRETLGRIDDALQAGDARAAVVAWRDAYAAALGSGEWTRMADVGDRALGIGELPEFRETPQAAARRSYLTALFRARARGSLDGVLRAAEGFAYLGDRAVVEQCLRVAGELAAREPGGYERVLGLAGRVASQGREAPARD